LTSKSSMSGNIISGLGYVAEVCFMTSYMFIVKVKSKVQKADLYSALL